MGIAARTCGVLVACTTLISAQAGAVVVVETSPVVHVAAPFSALIRLPPSLALKKGGIEAEASLVDAHGGESELAKKRKLQVSAGGEVSLEHELEGLLLGYVFLGLQFQIGSYICHKISYSDLTHPSDSCWRRGRVEC